MIDPVYIGWWTESGETVAHIIRLGGNDQKDHWSEAWMEEHFSGSDDLIVESLTGAIGADDAGMFYHDYLAGPDGAGFILFREPQHTLDNVKRAKERLRGERDVVRLEVVKIDKWKAVRHDHTRTTCCKTR